MIQTGEMILSEADRSRRGRLGAVVKHRVAGRICLVTPAWLLPGLVQFDSGPRAVVGWSDYSDPRQLGDYRSIAQALALAPLPEGIKIGERAMRSCEGGLARLESLVGKRLYLTSGSKRQWGRVRVTNAPLWLAIGDAAPEGYHGALEIVAERDGDRFAVYGEAGAALYTEQNRLAGFVVASDAEGCMAAPAETFFGERLVELASIDDIEAHNARLHPAIIAEPIRELELVGFGMTRAFGARVARTSTTFSRANG